MDTTCLTPDVMLVCRNGHVITDRLRDCPEQGLSHCDRCGAATLSRCPTCGLELPGALPLPGPVPIGGRRPPAYCGQCGAAFPWAPRPRPAAEDPLAALDALLRRLPLVARQLRTRQGERPPFRVEGPADLEDLVRALLPVHFDDALPELRTPAYTAGRRTDFVLAGGAVALTVKLLRPGGGEDRPAAELPEDVAYYQARPGCRALVCFLHDPEGRLPDPGRLEAAWSRPHDDLDVRLVVA
jgi:hypothetical protein